MDFLTETGVGACWREIISRTCSSDCKKLGLGEAKKYGKALRFIILSLKKKKFIKQISENTSTMKCAPHKIKGEPTVK